MTDNMVLEPLKLYKEQYQQKIEEEAIKYFDDLVAKSGIDVQKNVDITNKIYAENKKIAALKNKLSGLYTGKVFSIIGCVLTFLIFAVMLYLLIAQNYPIWYGWSHFFGGCNVLGGVPVMLIAAAINATLASVVAKVLNPKINHVEDLRDQAQSRVNKWTAEARAMLQPLYKLFDWFMSSEVVMRTTPLIKLHKYFDADLHELVFNKYKFGVVKDKNISTLLVKSGSILDNPFLYLRKFRKHMGTQVYHGFLTISWTETEYDSEGHAHTVVRTQTLTASVSAPMPHYNENTQLLYFNDAAPQLNFSRKPTGASGLSDRQVDRKVRRGERKIKRKEQKGGANLFTGMANTEFDVLFGALDRNNEAQFRLLFTPLAQQNIVELVRCGEFYGDDFTFEKRGCLNVITSDHAQRTNFYDGPFGYDSVDVRVLKNMFVAYTRNYFSAIYFDLAPLLSIPLYQQHRQEPIVGNQVDFGYHLSNYEHEALAYSFARHVLAHPETDTDCIFKASKVLEAVGDVDVVEITAYSYQIVKRVTYIDVYGGDGYWHAVPVPWDEYIPLKQTNHVAYKHTDLTRPQFGQLCCSAQFNELIGQLTCGTDDAIFERGILAISLGSAFTKQHNQILNKLIKEIKNNG